MNPGMKPADQIRAALKARGITRKQVSVIHDHYSLGSSIRIKIKDPAVSKALVAEVARQHECVDRDKATGEILSGGNRFVDVEYSGEALAPLVAQILPTLQVLKPDGLAVEVLGCRAFIAAGQVGGPPGFVTVVSRDGERLVHCWGPEFAARQLAERIANSPKGPDAR